MGDGIRRVEPGTRRGEVRFPVVGDGKEGEPEDLPDRPSANASLRQLSVNVAFSYVNFAIGIVLSLVLTRVLLRHLGASTYGLWIVLLALVGYLILLDLGVSTAAVQRVARLMAVGDREGVADLIRTLWAFFAMSGIAVVVVTVGLAPFLTSFLNVGAISPTVVGTTLVILGVMSALRLLAVVPNSILFGSGRNDRQSQIGLIALVLTQAGQVVAVLAGAGLIVLAIVQAAGVGLGFVLTSSVAGRVTGSSLRKGRFDGSLLRELLRFGGMQTMIALGSVVSFQLDAFVIGVILPVAQVAPYSVALNTANFTRSLSTQGSALLLPTYSHLDAVADRDRQAKYFFNAIMLSLAVSVPMVIAMAVFGQAMLTVWLGSVPPKTYGIMIALGVVTLLQLPGQQGFLFLTGAGRNRKLAGLAVLGASVNLIGSIVATYWLGPIGPAIGSLPVVLVLDFTVLPMMVCRYIGVPVGRYVRMALGPILPVGIAAATTALALDRLHPAHGGIAAIVSSVVVCIVGWAALVLIVARLEPELRAAVWQRVRRRRP